MAVKRQTNNRQVVVLSVETSEANNSVTIGVGPNRAPWRCLVKREIVADVMSLTDEGKRARYLRRQRAATAARIGSKRIAIIFSASSGGRRISRCSRSNTV